MLKLFIKGPLKMFCSLKSNSMSWGKLIKNGMLVTQVLKSGIGVLGGGVPKIPNWVM